MSARRGAVAARLPWLLAASAIVAGCPADQSAPIPREGECLADLRDTGNSEIVEFAGETLGSYDVVPCDSSEARVRVVRTISAIGTPAPCPDGVPFVVISIQPEGQPTPTTVCLGSP
ncbi:MAG TPA: hypothetical protein VFO73_04635 [Candidatus Limnocylindrales bacterium]|nr:hypothetical protein [Candidatus Limnocylindrales bacterium]